MKAEQPPIPGAEQMLQARPRTAQDFRRRANTAAYLGVSVQVSGDGSWRVYAVSLDPATSRVIPELLDSGEDFAWLRCSKAALIATWAEALDTGGDRY
jgi:hypothetical protein